MGMDIKFQENNGDSLEAFFNEIIIESEDLEKKMLKAGSEEAEKDLKQELLALKRDGIDRPNGRPALADDIVTVLEKDKWGTKSVKIRGGKLTGTLWHLVNDGTLHARATHFMDRVLQGLDSRIDSLWSKAGGKE